MNLEFNLNQYISQEDNSINFFLQESEKIFNNLMDALKRLESDYGFSVKENFYSHSNNHEIIINKGRYLDCRIICKYGEESGDLSKWQTMIYSEWSGYRWYDKGRWFYPKELFKKIFEDFQINVTKTIKK